MPYISVRRPVQCLLEYFTFYKMNLTEINKKYVKAIIFMKIKQILTEDIEHELNCVLDHLG